MRHVDTANSGSNTTWWSHDQQEETKKCYNEQLSQLRQPKKKRRSIKRNTDVFCCSSHPCPPAPAQLRWDRQVWTPSIPGVTPELCANKIASVLKKYKHTKKETIYWVLLFLQMNIDINLSKTRSNQKTKPYKSKKARGDREAHKVKKCQKKSMSKKA